MIDQQAIKKDRVMDLLAFCKRHFSHLSQWEAAQISAADALSKAATTTGEHSHKIKRGAGASSLIAAAAVWAIVEKHRLFVAILCRTYEAAQYMKEDVIYCASYHPELAFAPDRIYCGTISHGIANVFLRIGDERVRPDLLLIDTLEDADYQSRPAKRATIDMQARKQMDNHAPRSSLRFVLDQSEGFIEVDEPTIWQSL